MEWLAILQDIRKQTDPEGLQYVDYWSTQVELFDVAVKKGDLKGVATIFRNCVPAIRNLVPHLKDQKLQERVTSIATNAEKLVTSLEMDGANMSSLNGFFESETEAVVNLVNTELHNVVRV